MRKYPTTLLTLAIVFFLFSQGKSQTEIQDSTDFKKIAVSYKNITEIKSKVESGTDSGPVYTRLPTSGLDAYEKLLKDFEYEKIKANNQGLCTDEIDSKIAQLNAKIVFEKNKNFPDVLERPVYINTGNDVDIKRYNEAKNSWIKCHPEEYRKIVTPLQNHNPYNKNQE